VLPLCALLINPRRKREVSRACLVLEVKHACSRVMKQLKKAGKFKVRTGAVCCISWILEMPSSFRGMRARRIPRNFVDWLGSHRSNLTSGTMELTSSFSDGQGQLGSFFRALAGGGGSAPLDYSVLSVAIMTLALVLLVDFLRHKFDLAARGKPLFSAVLEGVCRERKLSVSNVHADESHTPHRSHLFKLQSFLSLLASSSLLRLQR